MEILLKIGRLWKAFADWVLKTVFHFVLFIFYFTIFLPFALFFKLFDKDAFKSGWFSVEESQAEDLY